MDVFYYWKCYEVDIEEKWLGRFVVDTKKMGTKKKLDEIKKAEPEFIWVFKIPNGCGKNAVRELPLLQLLARLAWSKEEIPGFPKSGRTGECLHYDPKHPDSIVCLEGKNLAKYSHQPFWPLSASVLYNSPGNNIGCYPEV